MMPYILGSSKTMFNAFTQSSNCQDEDDLLSNHRNLVTEGLEVVWPLNDHRASQLLFQQQNNIKQEIPVFRQTSASASEDVTRRKTDDDTTSTSGRRVNKQLQALNPSTPQSYSLLNGVEGSPIDLQQRVMSRSEWFTFFKSLNDKVTRELPPPVTNQTIFQLLELYKSTLPLKSLSDFQDRTKERFFSLSQVSSLLLNSGVQFEWDDFVDQLLLLRQMPLKDQLLCNYKDQTQVTVLKDHSIIIDCSLIRECECSLPTLLLKSMTSSEVTKVKALSLSGVTFNSSDGYAFDALSKHLVILNVSQSTICQRLFEETSSTFESLQFLNLSNNRLEDLRSISDLRFPFLKELIASGNQIGSKQQIQRPQRLPLTLKVLDLSYNSLQTIKSLQSHFQPHVGLVILDLTGNPMSQTLTEADLLVTKAWFPKVHTLLQNHTDNNLTIKKLSCFENFQEVAFKEKRVVVDVKKLEVIDVGAVTISNGSSPCNQYPSVVVHKMERAVPSFGGGQRTPTAKINLMSIMPSLQKLNRQLDFGRQAEKNLVINLNLQTQQSDHIVQEQSSHLPIQPLMQLPIKNDSLKYFNLYSREGEEQSSSFSGSQQYSRPHSSLIQESIHGRRVSLKISQSGNSSSHTARHQLLQDISGSDHNDQYSVETMYPQESPNQRLRLAQTASNQESTMAAYYENKKSQMTLQHVRSMNLKQPCTIKQKGSPSQKNSSPVKAMMIHKPPSLFQQSERRASTTTTTAKIIKLQRIEKSSQNQEKRKAEEEEEGLNLNEGVTVLLKSHSKTRNRQQQQSPIQPQRKSKSMNHQQQYGMSQKSLLESSQLSPHRIAQTTMNLLSQSSSGATESKKSAPERYGYYRSKSKTGSIMVTPKKEAAKTVEKGYKIKRTKEMTFNNNTNASHHNSNRGGAPLSNDGTQRQEAAAAATPQMIESPKLYIRQQVLVKQVKQQQQQDVQLLISDINTPRFSERSANNSFYPGGSRPSSNFNHKEATQEDQYSNAIHVINAQRFRNEQRKASTLSKISGRKVQVGQNPNLNVRDPSNQYRALINDPQSRARPKSSLSVKQQHQHQSSNSQSMISSRTTASLKIDLRKSKK